MGFVVARDRLGAQVDSWGAWAPRVCEGMEDAWEPCDLIGGGRSEALIRAVCRSEGQDGERLASGGKGWRLGDGRQRRGGGACGGSGSLRGGGTILWRGRLRGVSGVWDAAVGCAQGPCFLEVFSGDFCGVFEGGEGACGAEGGDLGSQAFHAE